MYNIENYRLLKHANAQGRAASFILQATSKIWSVSLSDIVIRSQEGDVPGLDRRGISFYSPPRQGSMKTVTETSSPAKCSMLRFSF